MSTDAELPIAFVQEDEVVVNFGALTGREATQAELDRLARFLNEAGAGPEITITASRRQEYAEGIETVAHLVHVSSSGNELHQVEQISRDWALDCANDRSVEPLE